MKLLVALAVLPGCFLFRSGDSASCPKDRTVELGLQDEVKKLAGCTQVSRLVIRTGATLELSPLAELEEITGDLSIGPTVGLDEAAFNGLLHVGGTIRVANNGSLRGLFFPRLERAGRIEIENNVVLNSISMPRLAAVDGAAVIADNGGLEMISAPLLVSVGKELVISGHAKLNLLEMSHLATVEALRVENNPKLPPETVEQLTSKSALDKPPTP
ncbi:MAG TPA: hypothetical protein VFV99_30965 [Kofleriaceae bacterium]|nr:hypothetical protein [Kofleriaceae bacterium]